MTYRRFLHDLNCSLQSSRDTSGSCIVVRRVLKVTALSPIYSFPVRSTPGELELWPFGLKMWQSRLYLSKRSCILDLNFWRLSAR